MTMPSLPDGAPRHRPWLRRTAGFALSAAGVLFAAAVALLGTTAGSRLVVRLLAPRLVSAERLTIGSLQGNFLTGLVFRGVAAEDLRELPKGNALFAERIQVDLSLWPPGLSRCEAQHLTARLPGWAEQVTADEAGGTLAEGVTLHELTAEGLPRLPDGSMVSIQRTEVTGWLAAAVTPAHLRFKIMNGRLRMPYAEPVIFWGEASEKDLSLVVYASAVDARELRPLFPRMNLLRVISGTLRDASLAVDGTIRQPEFAGSFTVDQLTRKGFALTHSPGVLQLRADFTSEPPQLFGQLLLKGGLLTSKSVMKLQPSRIIYAGDPKNPTYEMKAVSTVAGTTIRITLGGTRHQPELRLASTPPLSQERLLVMLATGRSLAGGDVHTSQGEISSDLAADFIDYFVLGGRGGELASRLGITGLSLTYEQDTNMVGVTTTIGDRVSVSYETEAVPSADAPPSAGAGTAADAARGPGAYKLGAEYHVTPDTSVRIEGERALIDGPRTSSDALVGGQTGTAAPTRDEVFLKLKRRF